ncbi:MAG TPA: alpha/beta hydrolase-fold protein [Solirubrobacteraceae bacterium]|nr:alpha/beta hydrolase-fold protein [Solirubrobacteraceae bacterium]
MALQQLQGVVGAPWARPLAGALDQLVVESDALAGNPLGDPARRPLYVYRPPGVELDHPKGLPTVFVIQGFTGQIDMWLSHSALEPNMIERVDAMFHSRACPDAIVVFVDAWTSRGGSQFINSASTGRYLDYLCDEVVPFIDGRYPTLASRDHRGLAGKSSGGYGAMVVPMLRPDVFGALASHAGDALFECCYLPQFRNVARSLRDNFEGSYDVFWEQLAAADHFDFGKFGDPFEMYGYASAYSPDLTAPGRALLPFEISTGRLIDDVWALWLEHDPVRMAHHHADALRSMHRIYLDAGKADEYFLDLGAQAFAEELSRIGAAHTLELFDGKHGGITYRYPGAIRELVTALQG